MKFTPLSKNGEYYIKMNIKELDRLEDSNVRILVDLKEYDVKKDTRLLIPFFYYQHYGLMNRGGEVVVGPQYDRILDSCYRDSYLIRVGLHYTYGFSRSTKEPSTYLRTKWGLLDCNGKVILDTNYKSIGISDDKKVLTLQHMDGQYEVINVDGEVIVPKGTYQWVDCFDSGLSRVHHYDGESKKYGIIDVRGNIILPIIYSRIWNFYKRNRHSTTIESIDEHGNKRVGIFDFITRKATI